MGSKRGRAEGAKPAGGVFGGSQASPTENNLASRAVMSSNRSSRSCRVEQGRPTTRRQAGGRVTAAGGGSGSSGAHRVEQVSFAEALVAKVFRRGQRRRAVLFPERHVKALRQGGVGRRG